MKNLPLYIICSSAILLSVFTGNSDSIGPVVSVSQTIPPGLHTVASNVYILSGATLTISPGSTVQVQQTKGNFIVEGGLHARDTLFMGLNSNTEWGWIFARPSSDIDVRNCTFYLAGSNSDWLPSNAVIEADSASVLISNCVFSIPRKSSVYVHGNSSCVLYDNDLQSSAVGGIRYPGLLLEYSMNSHLDLDIVGNIYSDNGVRHFGLSNIVVQGIIDHPYVLPVFDNDFAAINTLYVSNTVVTVPSGSYLSFIDKRETGNAGSIDVINGGKLILAGTPSQHVQCMSHTQPDWSLHYERLWRDISFHPGSTGSINYARIARAGNEVDHCILIDNAFLSISNSLVQPGYLYGIDVNNSGTLICQNITVTNFNRGGIRLSNGSYGYFRYCNLSENNRYDINSYGIKTDESSYADARYCWWGDSSGPYPYGTGDAVLTNNVITFPWLLSPPGSQIDPPLLVITSPQTETVSTPYPHFLLTGYAVDNSQITRVEYRNLNSSVTGYASIMDGTNWHAQMWLFEGINYIGVYAYDDEGNVTVAGTIIECTGPGSGDGGDSAPLVNKVVNKIIPENDPFSITLVAASPAEPAFLSYWADSIPAGSEFNQVTRAFSWPSPPAGVYSNVMFIVTDGTHTATNRFMITVVDGDPPLSMRIGSLPPAYHFNTYFVMLTVDNAVGPVEWSYDDINAPDGLALSREGIISGVPFGTLGKTFSFTATATDSRGDGFAAVKRFTINTVNEDPPEELRIVTQELPFTVSGTLFTATCVASNGYPGYQFSDGADTLKNLGLSMDASGVISGTVAATGSIPFTPYVLDQSNQSTFANISVSSIPQEHQLILKEGYNKLKLKVVNVPLKESKSAYILKTVILPPAGFTFDDRSIVTCMVGVNLVDGNFLVSSKPDKKLLFKQKRFKMLEKIKVVKTGKGEIKAMFVLKNTDLTHSYTKYGLLNEDVKDKLVTIPVWIKIGDYATKTEFVPVMVKSKFNKTGKGQAKW